MDNNDRDPNVKVEAKGDTLEVSFTLYPNTIIDGVNGILNKNGDFYPMETLRKAFNEKLIGKTLTSMGVLYNEKDNDK